jgi:small subunit ribosomal protein S9
MAAEQYMATGRRKTSVARVIMRPGEGNIKVNGKDLIGYFHQENLENIIKAPLIATETLSKYDITANVKGGGVSGQAGAVRHGISRTLLKADENLRDVLKKGGFLTRDPRMKERQKYGQKGARAKFQWTKR